MGWGEEEWGGWVDERVEEVVEEGGVVEDEEGCGRGDC